MKKIVKNRRGFTLLEVVLAVALIAMIALPLLTVFLQSVKTDKAAESVLNANYISQSYTETLDSKTYTQALSSTPTRVQVGDYYLTGQIFPHGSINASFDTQCDYAHLVVFSNETMLAVMPDGAWRIFASIPNNIYFTVQNGAYSLTCDGIVMTGDVNYFNSMLLVNAVEKNSSSSVSLGVGAQCRAVLYCDEYHTDDFTVDENTEVFVDMDTGEKSLVHVVTFVYDSATSIKPIATTESYFSLRNW